MVTAFDCGWVLQSHCAEMDIKEIKAPQLVTGESGIQIRVKHKLPGDAVPEGTQGSGPLGHLPEEAPSSRLLRFACL